MSADLTKPTIENPFAIPAKTKAGSSYKSPKQQRAVAKPIMKTSSNKILPLITTQKNETIADYQPGFYVSQASKRFVSLQIDNKVITLEELPTIYEMAFIISNLFGRPSPTLSDVEIAIQYKNMDTVKKIASGEQELDLVRREASSLKIIAKKERLEFWKIVATRLVEEFSKSHPSKTT